MSNIANNILSAVDIIVDKKLQEAKFDKTVIASVIKLIDPISLKYQVRYQDSILEARVGDGTLYEAGDSVFLLLPQNDLESSNWILGLASSTIVSRDKNDSIELNYTVQGKNVVSIIEGNEYINATVNNRIVLWKQTNKDEDNLIKIDANAFSSYAKIGDSFLLSAEFQSAITTNGNYGLEVIIKYNGLVNQKYVLDTSNMIGNYYNFTTFKRQIEAFPLYSEQAEIVEIALFTEGVAQNDTVTVQNISLQVAQQNEFAVGSDIVLNIVTPSGTTFYTDTDSEERGLLIEAHLEKKGARIFDGVEYYWFIENPLISAGQPLYNAYGGAGWEIINNSNIDPYKESYSVSFAEVPSNSRKFKVVVVYDGVAYAQEVTFFNTTSNKIQILMAQNDKEISCQVLPPKDTYIYQWYKQDLFGNLEIINGAAQNNYTIDELDGSSYSCVVCDGATFLGIGSIQVPGAQSTLTDVIIEYAYGDSSTEPPVTDSIITVGTNLRGKKVYISTAHYQAPGIQDNTTYLKVGDYILYISEYWQASSPDGSWGNNGGDEGTQNTGGNMQKGENTIHVTDSAYIQEGTEFTFPNDKDYIVEVYNPNFITLSFDANSNENNWSTIMPEPVVGKSLWQRVTKYYEDGTIERSYVCLTSSPSFLIELSNDGATISADSEGNINIAALPELTKTTVEVWYGEDNVTKDCDFEWTISPDNELNKLNTETEGTIYFTSINPADDTVQAIVAVTYKPDKENESTWIVLGTKTFTLSKVKGGAKGDTGVNAVDYKLIVSPNAINWSEQSGNVRITLTPQQIVGNVLTNLTLDGIYAYITTTGTDKITDSFYTLQNNTSSITFTLVVNNINRDAETIKTVKNGANGLNGITPIKGVDYFDGTDGKNGTSIIWKGEFDTAPIEPQNGWAYYNSEAKASYVFQDGAWYQMSVDGLDGVNGENGLSIVWKGESDTAPSNAQINWAYKDTNDNIVYIYTGAGWEPMVADGSDGTDGVNGTDGLSVYITYHNNSADSPPSVPTGDGTTNGWHTNATTSVVWISQKIAVSASEGTWGTPFRITGTDGKNGENGTSPYLVELSNDSATISMGADESLNDDTLQLLTETTVSVYQGDKDITTSCSFEWEVSENDEISANNEKTTTIYFTKITGENAFATVTVKKDSVEIGQKTFAVAIVKDGAEGPEGAAAVNYKLQISPSGVINWSDITGTQKVSFTVLKITGDKVETINSAIDGIAIQYGGNSYSPGGYVEVTNGTTEAIFTLVVNGIARDVERISGVKNGTQGPQGEQGPQGDPALPANTSENIRVYLINNSLDIPTKPSTSLGSWVIKEPTPDPNNIYVWTSTGNKVTTYSWKDESTKEETISTITYADWTTPELWSAYGADNIDNKTYATFIKLMNNQPDNGGLLYDNDGKLWINADFIQSNYILVKDANNNTIFSAASGDANSVIMGSFTVKGNSLYTNNKTSYNSTVDGVYIGTDGIGLGSNAFYVTKDGALYSVKGTIGGWSIGSKAIYDGTTAGMIKDGVGSHTNDQGSSSSNPRPVNGYLRFYAGSKKTSADALIGDVKKAYKYDEIASFYVTGDGYLYSEKGNIAGLNIGIKGNGLALYKFIKEAEPLQNEGDLLIAPAGITVEDLTGEIDNLTTYYFGLGNVFTIGSGGIVTCGSIYLQNSTIVGRIIVAQNSINLQGTWTLEGAPIATTSDINKKNSISNLSSAYDILFDNLNPVIYKYNDGTSNRYHTGFIAQNVLNAINIAGLSTQDFAGYIETIEDNEISCYLRYEEFIALNTAQIQALKARVAQLEEEIQLLKT